MDGRIVSVIEVEDKEGYARRQITITIPEPPMPYQPTNYVIDWRALQEQQSPFNEETIKRFDEYEEELRKFDKTLDELDGLHIGGVVITQEEEVKE